MSRTPIHSSGLPAPGSGAPQERASWLSESFTLGLVTAGLLASLLTLGGAAMIAVDPAIGEVPSRSCTAFQVGSSHAAFTRVHLENSGSESTSIDFRIDSDSDATAWPAAEHRSLAPQASIDVVFRTPALGATVVISSSGRNLRASTEIVRDNGDPPEIRRAFLCRALGPSS
jgi:hypothetical protein